MTGHDESRFIHLGLWIAANHQTKQLFTKISPGDSLTLPYARMRDIVALTLLPKLFADPEGYGRCAAASRELSSQFICF
jgi:hypothetical protein